MPESIPERTPTPTSVLVTFTSDVSHLSALEGLERELQRLGVIATGTAMYLHEGKSHTVAIFGTPAKVYAEIGVEVFASEDAMKAFIAMITSQQVMRALVLAIADNRVKEMIISALRSPNSD
jgi:hypothetical protein